MSTAISKLKKSLLPSLDKSLLTPFNIVAGIILLVGAFVTVLRFTKGLGGVTNLSDDNPWGIWISFDLLCGVALAAGGYTTSAACYVFGLKRFHSAVRPAILTAFLGYALVVFALHYDVGRPWRLPYPIFVQTGTTSVLFEVGLCVFLYLITLFIEWVPSAFEWLGFRKPRDLIVKITLALTIFGVVLSTMHQSSLGALYLIVPSKLHPLWYSPYLPLFFFVSSIAAGLSMVIFEGSISHKVFSSQISEKDHHAQKGIIMGLSKICAVTLFVYFFLQLLVFIHNKHWDLINTPMGYWYLLEIFGFVLVPMMLFYHSYRSSNILLIRIASILTMVGVILNRLNVTVIGFKWDMPNHYVPSWMEIVVTMTVLFAEIWIFRWVINRMPVLREPPAWVKEN